MTTGDPRQHAAMQAELLARKSPRMSCELRWWWPRPAASPVQRAQLPAPPSQATAEAATVNRETSALSRMFQLAIRRGQLERMPLFPKRLEENPPRDGFFEHAEFLKVRALLAHVLSRRPRLRLLLGLATQ